jgi:4-oxalocrotonate tautomerase
MPTLLLKLSPPPEPSCLTRLATVLTELTAATLGKRADVTAVVIEALPQARWFIGGTPLAGTTALLEISITAGTNTPDEKARFIEAAFAELQRQLSPDQGLEPASYVIVRELPASDWGYGGRTQGARRVARDVQPT